VWVPYVEDFVQPRQPSNLASHLLHNLLLLRVGLLPLSDLTSTVRCRLGSASPCWCVSSIAIITIMGWSWYTHLICNLTVMVCGAG
jgi:hypothetical protein